MTTPRVRYGLFLLTGVAVGAAALMVFQWSTAPPDLPERSLSGWSRQAAREAITAIGTVEPKEGVLDLRSSLIGHRIKAVPVNEAQNVEANELLIEIDDEMIAAERELALAQQLDAKQQQAAQVALAQEQVLGARLSLEQLEASGGPERDAQQARIDVLEKKREQAEKDCERLVKLNDLPEPRVSTQQVEHQKLLVEIAKAEREAADAEKTKLERALEFKIQTANAELRIAERNLDLARADPRARSLKEQVALADLKHKQTRIVAPVDGFVLNIYAQEDELVGQQPLLTFADLSQFVCVMEIDVADIQHLYIEQKVEVMGRAFGDVNREPLLYGKIIRIGRMVSTPTLQPLSPLEPVDRRVVKVVAEIDSGDTALGKIVGSAEKDRRPALVGLQVRIQIPILTNRDS